MKNHSKFIKTLNRLIYFVCTIFFAYGQKNNSVFFPPSRQKAVEKNIASHEWAKNEAKKATDAAAVHAALPLEFFWDILASPAIPAMGWGVNRKYCPNCGEAMVKAGGINAWTQSVEKGDWKTTCPHCKETFPKNDFKKYYESGLNDKGNFSFDKADKKLLFNAEHPDPADPSYKKWVDDGFGFTDEKFPNEKFYPVAHYNNVRWKFLVLGDPLITRFKNAHIANPNDPRYARALYVMLARAADSLPLYNYAEMRGKGFQVSDGGTRHGIVLGCIWDCFIASEFSTAYDIAFNTARSDIELMNFIQKKNLQFPGRPQQKTFHELSQYIGKNLIEFFIAQIKNGNIAGNEGMHQRALLECAAVLPDKSATEDAQRWLFTPNRDQQYRAKSIQEIFIDKIYADGMPAENASGYNFIWANMFAPLAGIINLNPVSASYNIYTQFPFFRTFIHSCGLIQAGDFYMHTGDSFNTGGKGLAWWFYKPEFLPNFLNAYREYGDDIYLRLYYDYYLRQKKDNTDYAVLSFPLDTENADVLEKKIREAYKKNGPSLKGNTFLPHSGHSITRLPGKDEPAVVLYFGGSEMHGHCDTMNLGIFRWGMDLMPDLGYPEFTGFWPKRAAWTSHNISHNTVTVNKKKFNRIPSSSTVVFRGENAFCVADELENPYANDAAIFRRTIVTVTLPEENFYVFDLFRVDGGTDHRYSLHGGPGAVSVKNLNMKEQKSGTYAGENIPYGTYFDGPSNNSYTGSGFSYLDTVRRDSAPGRQFSVNWSLFDYWNWSASNKAAPGTSRDKFDTDVALSFTYCGDPIKEAALCRGYPPKNNGPEHLEYAILTRYTEKKEVEDFIKNAKWKYIQKPDAEFRRSLDSDSFSKNFRPGYRIDDDGDKIIIDGDNPRHTGTIYIGYRIALPKQIAQAGFSFSFTAESDLENRTPIIALECFTSESWDTLSEEIEQSGRQSKPFFSQRVLSGIGENISEPMKTPHDLSSTLAAYSGKTIIIAIAFAGMHTGSIENAVFSDIELLLAEGNQFSYRSIFAGILEPHQGKPRVGDIEPLTLSGSDPSGSDMARAFMVQLAGGETDYLFFSADPRRSYEYLNKKLKFSGLFGIIRTSGTGKIINISLSGGSEFTINGQGISGKKPVYSGTVNDFCRVISETNQWITVQGDFKIPPGENMHCTITPKDKGVRPSATYPVAGTADLGKNMTRVLLGPVKLVKKFVDTSDHGKGYEWLIQKGDEVRAVPTYSQLYD